MAKLMKISHQEIPEVNLVIIRAEGTFCAVEWRDYIYDLFAPIMFHTPDKLCYVVTDFEHVEMDFTRFIEFISYLSKRRKDYSLPNFRQFLIGDNKWISNIRSIMKKQFNEDIGVFQNIDDAVEFVWQDYAQVSQSH